MLTDAKIRSLKPQEKAYKIADRDGLYVTVLPSGTVSFRYNYRVNGRQETMVFGRYGVGGMSLMEAREKLNEARRLHASGQSPARQKQRDIRRSEAAGSFGAWYSKWLTQHGMADSTRDMRKAVYERDLKGPFGGLKMHEITHDDLRALCDKIVERGAPATAVHAREIVMMVYRYAAEKGHEHKNPADLVKPSSIATFKPRDRALSPAEIGLLYEYLGKIQASPVLKLAVKLLLLTMVRKGELVNARWDEFNFTEATWEIPKERMKLSRPHVVYLSRQAVDILIALKTCAGESPYVLPSRYDIDVPISDATLNRVTTEIYRRAQSDDRPLGSFTVHDLRRTASTLLHEAGFNSDWIEKALAHEQKGVRAIYNRAQYADQRKWMLQEWADVVDAWTTGRKPGESLKKFKIAWEKPA